MNISLNTLLSHGQSDGEGLNGIARVPKKEGVSFFRSSRKSGKNSARKVECADTLGRKTAIIERTAFLLLSPKICEKTSG